MDSAALRRQGLLNESLSIKLGLPLYKLLVKKVPESFKNSTAIAIALGCLSWVWDTVAQDPTHFPCGERSILNWLGNSLPVAAFPIPGRCCSGCWGRRHPWFTQLWTLHAPLLIYQERCAHWHNTGKNVYWSVIVSFRCQLHNKLDSAGKRGPQPWDSSDQTGLLRVCELFSFSFLLKSRSHYVALALLDSICRPG